MIKLTQGKPKEGMTITSSFNRSISLTPMELAYLQTTLEHKLLYENSPQKLNFINQLLKKIEP